MIHELEPEALWRYYQRGYHCLVRSGLYFRQLLRPALSHVYFQRAMPLLAEYARANNGADLPPGFGDQMAACPLSARDLLHMDYAICLGYAEMQVARGKTEGSIPMDWPGPGGSSGVFIAADAVVVSELETFDDDFDEDEDDEDDAPGDSKPPFDL